MDKILECAKAFEKLLDTQYHIVIGKKGKSKEIDIAFETVDFHHLSGLHKLTDLRLSRANREKLFDDILSGGITLSDIERSRNFRNIQNRLEPLAKIEDLFDKNNLIFRYNEKANAFSLV